MEFLQAIGLLMLFGYYTYIINHALVQIKKNNELKKPRNGSYIGVLGSQIWYKDGQVHRENGPAVINIDGVYYYINNKIHRVDGPAAIYKNGTKFYYLWGEQFSKEEWFNKLTIAQQEHLIWNIDQF